MHFKCQFAHKVFNIAPPIFLGGSRFLKRSVVQSKGAVVQFGLRFAPGARAVRGSNPRGPTRIILGHYLRFLNSLM